MDESVTTITGAWRAWLRVREENLPLDQIPPAVLESYLCCFLAGAFAAVDLIARGTTREELVTQMTDMMAQMMDTIEGEAT